MSSSEKNTKERIRLPFLDGIRGLSALYVVFYHMLQDCQGAQLPKWTSIFAHGHSAVTVFIVLSGFSLMLPVSSSGADKLTNLKDFFIRRSRRILPPYYAAFVFSVAIVLLLPQSFSGSWETLGIGGGFTNPALIHAVIAHLLVVHNLNPDWIFKINSPMWSVATEWDIYFLFPLILLPIRKSLGIGAAIISGFIFGLISLYPPLFLANFWYLGCFAIGMFTADIAYGRSRQQFIPALLLSATIVAAIGSLILGHNVSEFSEISGVQGFRTYARFAGADILGAFGTCAFILALNELTKRGKSILVSFLSSRPIDQLGMMSYSLYLIHDPIVYVTSHLLKQHGLSGVHLYYALIATIPAILIITYLFHIVFERPFMRFKKVAAQSTPINEPLVESPSVSPA